MQVLRFGIWLVLVVGLMPIVGGCRAGFVSIGGTYGALNFDETDVVEEAAGFAVGAGIALDPDGPGRQRNPLNPDADKKRKHGPRRLYAEAAIEHVPEYEGVAGGGIEATTVRLGFRSEASNGFYIRTGAQYLYLDGTGENGSGGGLYAGLGYDFPLDDEGRWTLSPELLLDYNIIEVDFGGVEIASKGLGGRGGVFLTYRFRGRK